MQLSKPHFNFICPCGDGEVLRSEQVISKVSLELKSHHCTSYYQSKQHLQTKNGGNELCKVLQNNNSLVPFWIEGKSLCPVTLNCDIASF